MRQRVKGTNTLKWSEEMDVSRSVYSRDLKIAAMRALDAGCTNGEIARKYKVSPHLLERWRGEWRAKGDLAFPGLGRRGVSLPASDDARGIAELAEVRPTHDGERLFNNVRQKNSW